MRMTLRFFPNFLINVAASYFMLATANYNFLKLDYLNYFLQITYNLIAVIIYYQLALIVDNYLKNE